MNKLESQFQAEVIRELKQMFPGCIVLKNDENYIQGFPDLTLLYGRYWAVLECKRSKDESYRPNQEYYLDKCNSMNYGAMICPENKKEVYDDLQFALQS